MKDLTIGNEYKVILKFSIPILIGNLFQQLYNVIDSIIVGNFLGKNDLAAVGFSFNIILLLLALSMGINGVWIATPIGWTGGLAIRLAYYFFGNWRYKNILISTIPGK